MNDRRPRLALFMPSFRGGGAERVMVTLAEGFAARGVAIDVLVAQREGPFAPAASDRIRVVDLRAVRVAASIVPLARYLRREAPPAMLSALPHANVAAILARGLSARRTTRLVVSEHATASLVAANAVLRRARLLPFFMRRLYPRADAVVAVSDGVAEDLARYLGLDRARIRRIYNPIVMPASGARAERVPHPWFEPGQPPVLLAAGRLTAQKDFETLVRAFALLRGARAARLMVLGQGEQRPQLLALAEQLGVQADIALPGFVADLKSYLERAAVFILSSRWEGFGNVLVEAMACAVPVVSTDCPSGPREILEGGRHGLLVPVADPPALAHAIESQLDHPMRDSVAARARDFAVEIALDAYQEVLEL